MVTILLSVFVAMNIEVASALPDYLKETNVVIKDYNKDIAEQEAKIEHLKKEFKENI